MTKAFKRAILEATGEHQHFLMRIYMNRCFYSEAKRKGSAHYKNACRMAIRSTAKEYRNFKS